MRAVFQLPASMTSVVLAPLAVSSDASPTRPLCAVKCASMPSGKTSQGRGVVLGSGEGGAKSVKIRNWPGRWDRASSKILTAVCAAVGVEDIEKRNFSMLAAHYTQNQSVNKGFPGDRLKWALAQDLDPTAKLVLVVLTDHYNVAREDTYPSAGKIAERSGFCTKTVTRALARLELSGLIEATRKVGRATVWRLHIGPRLVEQEQVDQVDPQEPTPPVTKNRTPRPTWLKQRVKDLTYWREVYDGGGDLDGMPLHIGEQIFEESRQTPVDKPVSKSADLGHRVLLTRKGNRINLTRSLRRDSRGRLTLLLLINLPHWMIPWD